MAPGASWQKQRRRVVSGLVAAALAAGLAARPGSFVALAAAGAGAGQGAAPVEGAPAFLAKAYGDVDALAKLVHQKGMVPDFGKRAADIVRLASEAAAAAGVGAESAEQALDPPLRALFLMQLQTLLARAADVYDAQMAMRPNPLQASLAAKQTFLDGVSGLVRPGSGWDSEGALEDLVGRLEESYRSDSQLVNEQAKQGTGKQVTIEVIRKLQQQAASVLREADTRGAFPWNVKWQYFVENSPLGFRGSYSQGRSVVELLLMPDPRQKKNILNRIGPLNLAVAFDMLM